MRWQQILDRFRPVTAPGGAAESAEHAAHRTGAALELSPVFTALDEDLSAAASVREDARSRAAAIIAAARSRSSDIMARARLDAPAREAAAASAILSSAADEDERLVREAEDRARSIVAERSVRLDETADAVIYRLMRTWGARR